MQYNKSTLTLSSWIFFIGWAMALVGLCTSPALMSISVGCLLLGAVLSENFKTGLGVAHTWLTTGWFWWLVYGLLHIIALGYTQDTIQGWDEIRIKLPLFILPLAFYFRPPITQKQLLIIQYLFLSTVAGVTLATLGYYVSHLDVIHQGILASKPLPIIAPYKNLSHIYFSVIMAVSIGVGTARLFQPTYLFQLLIEKIICGLIVLFLTICLHIFTTRTGLVAFYAGMGMLLAFWVRRQSNFYFKIGLPVLMFALGLGAFSVVPSLRLRVQNTISDLKAYQKQEAIENWSVGSRFLMWELAVRAVQTHPFTGVGPGDVKAYLFSGYDTFSFQVPHDRRLTDVHNQYLETAAGLGFPGVCVLFLGLGLPLLVTRKKMGVQAGFYYSTQIIFLAAMGTESILERQVGILLFVSSIPFYEDRKGS